MTARETASVHPAKVMDARKWFTLTGGKAVQAVSMGYIARIVLCLSWSALSAWMNFAVVAAPSVQTNHVTPTYVVPVM